jgi:Protein of unknown function (DUF3306)
MATDRSSPDNNESGFLSRWSQRKQAIKKGEVLAEPVVVAAPSSIAESKQNTPLARTQTARDAPDSVASKPPEKAATEAKEQPPAPTMKDVHALTPQSDFKPFMRADVAPEVKNAAMKQLFKDPHFNVMDMMDVYVDDYSKPDPMPPEMLRKLAVTQFLGFWKEEEEEAAKQAAKEKAALEKKAREDAGHATPENVAKSSTEEKMIASTDESQALAADARASQTEHDHPDLQLQPDDAAGRERALQRAG